MHQLNNSEILDKYNTGHVSCFFFIKNTYALAVEKIVGVLISM